MFNNPYTMFPYQNQLLTTTKPSILKTLSNIKWGNLLNNTQKTLNVINQAIPVYYQVKPIWGNLKSFSKILSEFKETDTNNNNNINNQREESLKEKENNLPTFFIN